MKRLLGVAAALVALNVVLMLLGLGNARQATSGRRVRVGVVFDVGGLGDKSFNDAAYRGLMRAAAELDIDPHYVEPGDGSDRESAIRQLADEGMDVVFGVGFIFTDDLKAAATKFPQTKFGCVDFSWAEGQPLPPPNLVGLRFREEEGAFLVGALAALTSPGKKVGFVGGMDIPLIRKFEAGYRAGVKHVCADCTVVAAYAGTEPKAFNDPTTGKELALAQYGQGVDVIFHASGKTGNGVFLAAKEKGKRAIGTDSDQFAEAPCCVMTSMVKDVDVAVFETIKAQLAGTFPGGQVQELGLEEGGVDYIYDDNNKKFIPDDVHAKLEALRAELIAGKIQVPRK